MTLQASFQRRGMVVRKRSGADGRERLLRVIRGPGVWALARGSSTNAVRVGVISDTHGLLRPEALAALRGSDLIVHAGDIGGPHILEELNAIAPVTAVRGNNDREGWARRLPETAVLEVGGARLYVIHDVNVLTIDPREEGFTVVISGHSHQPLSVRRSGILFFNPGSAGPRRFRLPVSVGTLQVSGGRLLARLRRLPIG